MPSLRDLDCLVKNVTVIGIIGNIQGVTNATSPAKNPAMKITKLESFSFFFCLFGFIGSICVLAPDVLSPSLAVTSLVSPSTIVAFSFGTKPLNFTFPSVSKGPTQPSALHNWKKLISKFKVNSSLVSTSICCLKVAFFSK